MVPVLTKIAQVPAGLTGDPLFCQLQARAIIQLKIALQMQLSVRSGQILRQVTFNARKCLPLVTEVQLVAEAGLAAGCRLVYTRDFRLDRASLIATLGFEHVPAVDFSKALLDYADIQIPQILNV